MGVGVGVKIGLQPPDHFITNFNATYLFYCIFHAVMVYPHSTQHTTYFTYYYVHYIVLLSK